MSDPHSTSGPQFLERRLHAFAARYRIATTVTVTQWVAFGCVVVGTAWILCDKLLFLGGYYDRLAAALSVLGLAAILVTYLRARIDEARICYLIDRHAGLKNLVASARSTHADDEIARTVQARANDAIRTQTPRQVMPLQLQWSGRYLYVPCLALVTVLFLPQQDVLKRKLKQDLAVEEQKTVNASAIQLKEIARVLKSDSSTTESSEAPALSAEIDELAKRLESLDKAGALKALTEFEAQHREEFAEQRAFERLGAALEAASDPSGLSDESRKALNDLREQFSSGDVGEAAETLRQLAEAITKLPPQEQRAMLREMAKLGAQMEALGLNPELAAALAEMDADAADLANVMEQCERAAANLEDLAQQCSACADMQAMQKGLENAKRAMVGDDFKDFDAKAVESYLASQAANRCQAGLGQMGAPGGNGQGGTGGEGQGRGGQPPESPTQTAFQDEKSPSQATQGKILHELFVSGVPEKGEALQEYTALIQAARTDAAGALARDKVPREYEDMVKRYFDAIDTSPKRPSFLNARERAP